MSNNPYLLLTPGPLSTSETVRQAMLQDWCTWDDDYNVEVVQTIRQQLVALASSQPKNYSSVLIQGSGTASVEAVLGSALSSKDKILVINNGVYGARMVEILTYLNIAYHALNCGESRPPTAAEITAILIHDSAITHIAMVHCETTTGMLNPLAMVAQLAKSHHKKLIIDAMSSFGGIEIDVASLNIEFLISSANKCIQGVPGFGLVIAKRQALQRCAGQARSLSLDLHAQWQCMEQNQGKWRFTSPTHTVRAFAQALHELAAEGGIKARYQRYNENQKALVEGMQALGFSPLLDKSLHSPFITSFYSPQAKSYQFKRFYQQLKAGGFVIYPGKVSQADCFRIGNIGEVYPEDIQRLLKCIAVNRYWLEETDSND